jgi:integrase
MRGDGRIFKRGATYWCAYSLNGKECRESCGTSEEKKAQKYLQDRRNELGADKIGARKMAAPSARRVTIGKLVEALRADFLLRGKLSAPNACHLARAEKDFGTIRASQLTPKNIDDYITEKRAAGVADATINRTLAQVKQAYKLGVRQSTLANVPYIRRLSEEGNERSGFLTPSQFLTLLPHIPADLRDFVEFGYMTGQRKGETRLMTWGMLDGNALRIPRSITKNKKGRVLPLDTKLAAIIERRRRAARQIEEDGTARLAEYIFHRGDGQPIGNFDKSWKTACKQAGLAPGTLYHDCRRSAVKNLIAAGVPRAIAMKVSGHRSESVFERYNIKLDPEVRAAMEQAEAYRAKEAAKQKTVPAVLPRKSA